jgi:hypothetical protein
LHKRTGEKSNFGHAVWDKATPQERAMLKEIANRPVQYPEFGSGDLISHTISGGVRMTF